MLFLDTRISLFDSLHIVTDRPMILVANPIDIAGCTSSQTIILGIIPIHEIMTTFKTRLGEIGNFVMLKASSLQLLNDVFKHLCFELLFGQRELASSHAIHKDCVIFQNQAIEAHVGNIEGKSLSDILFDLVHGLRRKCINEVDRNIVKTSQLQTVDIVINVLLLVASTNLLEQAIIKSLHAQ